MARKVTQIQFTQQQIEQLDELKRQTGLTARSSSGERWLITYCRSGSTVISQP